MDKVSVRLELIKLLAPNPEKFGSGDGLINIAKKYESYIIGLEDKADAPCDSGKDQPLKVAATSKKKPR